MNYKPFDQEKWAAGDQIQFRNGQTDIELFYSSIRASSGNYPPLISIDASGIHRFHSLNGKFTPEDNGNGFDLVMAPKKVTYYFASWSGEHCQPSGRFASMMHPIRKWIEDHYGPLVGRQNYQIHTIEIEE